MEPADDPSVFPLAALVFAFVLWVIIVVILLPRLLGRLIAFIFNRRGSFHIAIPSMHIYPLAGRIVAHSVQYTIPDGTIAVEELVLQIRWWRKFHEQPFRQLLTVDDPLTLHPVAVEQQQMERENSAFWARSLFYRLRRWWQRTAVVTESNSNDPRPLISLICVGLRARLVNDDKNYAQLKKVMDAAQAATATSDHDDDDTDAIINFPLPTQRESEQISALSAEDPDATTSSSDYSSVASVDEKPFHQHLLELASLRINDGAFYFCDMGESPLVRLTVNSAKLRYRYGAPPCPADECRKRVRVRVSGLCISAASHKAVQTIVASSQLTPPEKVHLCPTNLSKQTEHSQTNRMIQRLVSMGSSGIVGPHSMADGTNQTTFPLRRKTSRKRPRSIIPRLSDLQYKDRREAKVARKPQVLPCCDILTSATTVIDYVFDEPGMGAHPRHHSSANRDSSDRSTSRLTDGQTALPPPVCRVSVLLRGALFSFDPKAIADVERVIARLQPTFYHLVPVAQKLQMTDGRRSANGIEIEIDATPVVPEVGKDGEAVSDIPVVKLPFVAREKTWKSLMALGVRKWPKENSDAAETADQGETLPESYLALHSSRISFRTEVPLEVGKAQTFNISLKDMVVNAAGVVDMPMGRAKNASITRVVQHPAVWNDEHQVTADLLLTQAEITYLPDFMRIIDDINATIQNFSKQPSGVRYFVPYKEVVTIRAEQGYNVICSCSHTNAWHDIHEGIADDYGRIKIVGETGELVLSPNVPTEYFPDSTVLSWSLSLPDAVGKLEFLVLGQALHQQDVGSTSQIEHTAESRSNSYRGRAPSLARRVRSQLETFAAQSMEKSNSIANVPGRRIEIDTLRVGSTFKLSGKVLAIESRGFLGSSVHAFLDAVNRSDMALKASSIALDLNPHHITSFLNLIRNYSGPGLCTLKDLERNQLDEQRVRTLRCVLDEARYPKALEALRLGLGAGYTLSSFSEQSAMDDIVCMTFQIDYLLVRLYDLPHRFSPFDKSLRNICSLDCSRFSGGIEANRLGLNLTTAPDSRNNVVALHGGYIAVEKKDEEVQPAGLPSLVLPKVVLNQVLIQKKTWASEEWGAYYSELVISIESLTGCLLDSTAACLSRIGAQFLPDQLHEESFVAASLLSVDNIDIKLGRGDVLVLSPSSSTSANRSGQMNSLSHGISFPPDDHNAIFSEVPKFLIGVTQVRLPFGLRFHMTNSATESISTRSRFYMPDVSMDLLMPSDGKLIPWMDDVTLYAQVAHSTTLRHEMARGMFNDAGLVRRAAEVRCISLDIFIESRPRWWATHVFRLQRTHVSQQSSIVRGNAMSWCNEEFLSSQKGQATRNSRIQGEPWWLFLLQSKRAPILASYANTNVGRYHRMDSVSIRLVSDAAILIAPESFEVVNDIVVRIKESVKKQNRTRAGEPSRNAEETLEHDKPSIACIIELWKLFEKSRTPKWALQENVARNCSLRAVETKGIRIILTTPVITMDLSDPSSVISRASIRDEVSLSILNGIQFLHVAKTEPIEDDEGGGNVTHTKSQRADRGHMTLRHGSIPSIVVHCSDRELAKAVGIVCIVRSKVKFQPDNNHKYNAGDERHTLVTRLASLQIGSKDSSLRAFASLGRIGSIFLLMSRAVGMEALEYTRLKKECRESISDKLLSMEIHDVLGANERAVRRFLVDMSQVTVEQRQLKMTTLEERSDEMRFHAQQHECNQDGSNSSVVNSIDALFTNLSLRILNQDIFFGDSFRCTGGSSSGAKHVHSTLGGYVLNASFGKLSTSIRDNIAADSLQMVSEVASFVRRAALSIPMLSHAGPGDSPSEITRTNLLSFNRENDEYRGGCGSHTPQSGVDHPPAMNERHLGVRSSYRSRRHNHKGARLPVPRGLRHLYRNSVPPRSHTTQSSRSSIRTPAIFSPISSQLPSPMRLGSPWKPPPEHAPHPPTNKLGSINAAASYLIPPELPSPVKTFENMTAREAITDDPAQDRSTQPIVSQESRQQPNEPNYALVAIRTAGENGPPRKRSKSMVRITPVVPPAFSELSNVSSGEAQQGLSNRRSPARVMPPRSASSSELERRRSPPFLKSVLSTSPLIGDREISEQSPVMPPKPESRIPNKRIPQITLVVSCKEIASRYYRWRPFEGNQSSSTASEPDISFVIAEPRLTFMSAPEKGSNSVVFTAAGARLQSANNPNCVLRGSIGKIGITTSLAQNFVPSTLPKLITSAQVSHFKTVLHATDLQSVLTFREEFKKDVKAMISAFFRTRYSISEMARATRLSSSRAHFPSRAVYSTLSFDLRCEDSVLKLEGFHPKDSDMELAYTLQGMFFSLVASEDDKAALTLGLRLYGHGVSVAAPSWESSESLKFPSLDARGVQWGEATGLPTLLKVTAEPIINSTSIHGLRHVLFTVSGLMAFQNINLESQEAEMKLSGHTSADSKVLTANPSHSKANPGAGTPFTRSFAAWERTKGVRMDISIRPMSFSLSSGQVVALFDVETITGIFEWNKLVVSGVQLHTAVSVPRISLSLIRMPTSDFSYGDIRRDEKRTSLSIALEKARLDLLKTQEDLTHTFIFRLDVFKVSGHIRPWKLLLDAASWADEQEFVSELHSIDYSAASTARHRQTRTPVNQEQAPVEHRVILIGAKLRRFLLAVPLLNSEDIPKSRLALRATELHLMARERFDSSSTPTNNVVEMKSHFIGILWEQSPLLSSHHARITFSIRSPTQGSTALFGPTSVILVPGTWRICPRKDVVMAILDAKNRKENKSASEKTKELLAHLPDYASRHDSSIAGDTLSIATERQGRVLFEAISLKALKTSGFIEGLDDTQLKSTQVRPSSGSAPKVLQASKVSVPAFSIAYVREVENSFDLVDIDFSGRTGEFPRTCLGKVSNLLSELLGAVASDQEHSLKDEHSNTATQPSRDIARDISVLIRLGKSLYRGQEDLHLPLESKFGIFAGKSSSILMSLRTAPLFGDETSHSTVITGVSPKLALEITPVIEGAKVQVLRFKDARILHGISPLHPSHTLLHVNRVIALAEAKTMLLTESHLRARSTARSCTSESGSDRKLSASMATSERNVLLMLGKPRTRKKGKDDSPRSEREAKADPDIRLQLKLPSKDDAQGDQVDLFVERTLVGLNCVRPNKLLEACHLNLHTVCHEVLLRAKWDILQCKVRLREDMLCYDESSTLPSAGGTRVLVNIINRLQFESMQFERNTVKLDIDALAAICAVPSFDVLIESTSVHSEVTYTMKKAVTRLMFQMKKLRNEVKLLTERDMNDSNLRNPALLNDRSRDTPVVDGKSDTGSMGSSSSSVGMLLLKENGMKKLSRKAKIFIKGEEFVALLRGYQFDETRHSARIALSNYDLSYRLNMINGQENINNKGLDMDFSEMRLSYSDEVRGINSDLFRVPSPQLRLSIADSDDALSVELLGNLLVKLGHGFYNWPDFKKLAEQTIMGITHTPTQRDEPEVNQISDATSNQELWNGRVPRITVRLNPKIDVIGDLTADVIQMMSARLGNADVVPKLMHDNLVLPLEAVVMALCDPLYK